MSLFRFVHVKTGDETGQGDKPLKMEPCKCMLFKLPFLLACVTSIVRVVESSIFSNSVSRTVLSTFLLLFSIALTWRIWKTPYFPGAYASSFTTALALMIMVFAIELISLFVAVEEAYECSSRLSWCGSPDHFTVSVLLSVISHCVFFVISTKGSRRRNLATTVAAAFAWLATTAIVLNIYNGDLLTTLDIHENYEYTLTHFLVVVVAAITDDDDLLLWATPVLAILFNLYWVANYPFYQADDRHRTEFYDTQVYIAMTYHFLLAYRCITWTKHT